LHENLNTEDSSTREIYFLVIILIVVIWYGIVPITGAVYNRYKWGHFRNRFNKLRQITLLDYRKYRQLPNDISDALHGLFRFSGGIESITDGRTLWVKGEDLTIPVLLNKSRCYLLPIHEGLEPEAPELIRWNQVSTLTEGAKVFIAGQLVMQNNRLNFGSTKENPLMVIFYNCSDNDFPREIISGARMRSEYWNSLTPASIVIGVLSLIYIAAMHLGRPAYHLTVITALVAVFIPILPIFPPGLLLTAIHRRLSQDVRKLKANLDLARFGLPTGTKHQITSRYAISAYLLEAFAILLLFIGICINVVFIFLLLIQFKVISI